MNFEEFDIFIRINITSESVDQRPKFFSLNISLIMPKRTVRVRVKINPNPNNAIVNV